MKEYLLALLAASLCAMLIGFFAPSGVGGGLSAHLKLLLSLVLICVLVSPLAEVSDTVRDWLAGDLPFWETDEREEDYRTQLEDSLSNTSKSYFIQMLTETLRREFSLEDGEVRCVVQWNAEETDIRPTRVTVLLSGRAIWKDPHAIKDYVEALLQCECVVAVE